MNISLDAFTKLCAEHIRRHEPILAYRHNNGWGRLRLSRTAKAATVKAVRKAVDKLRKSRYTIATLCVVDYDGQSLQVEGDAAFVAAMQDAMGEIFVM